MKINWLKFGRSLRLQGALAVMVACISQLWPESVFVFVGITILGMIIEGPDYGKRGISVERK